jgi:hypothetical protein
LAMDTASLANQSVSQSSVEDIFELND